MSMINKLYKEFFGLQEQAQPTSSIPKIEDKDIEQVEKYTAALDKMKKTMSEEQIEEAQLINHITDYRGGIEYVLRDPATAQSSIEEIEQWAAKKGITLVTKNISKSGKVVYLYFRLGQDPSADAQKLQGYLAQMPDLKHFRFNVRQPKRKIQPEI